MSFSTNNTILGIRILVLNCNEYTIEYEFMGQNWRERAMLIIPNYIGDTNVKFQTLCSFSSSHDITTGRVNGSMQIWLDNLRLKITDLYN
jgi:hypothetical protein